MFNQNWWAYGGGTPLTLGSTSASQAYIVNGVLTIQTDNSGYGCCLQATNNLSAPLSSPGAVVTSGPRIFQYGHYEARIKFNPTG